MTIIPSAVFYDNQMEIENAVSNIQNKDSSKYIKIELPIYNKKEVGCITVSIYKI